MGEFFKPLRRKLGVLTLLMACLFMNIWVRSLNIYDCAIFYSGLHTTHSVFSERHLIGFQFSYERLPQNHPVVLETNWGTNTPPDAVNQLLADARITWHFRWCGFSDCEYLDFRSNGCQCRIWIIPYWSVTIPLTLISLWLLLSRPRKSTSKKIAEPISAEGA